MAGSRQYRRNKSGQFAGAGTPGAKVTMGRAGGFANASFRSRVVNNRAAKARHKALVQRGVRVGVAAGVGAAIAVGKGKGVRDATAFKKAVQPVVNAARRF